jgi:hypothetical protein
MKCGVTLSATLLSVMLLGGCGYGGEGGFVSRPGLSSYAEMKSWSRPLTPAQEAKRYGECPRPNGLFEDMPREKNTPEEKHARPLSDHFRVEGFEVPATTYPGGTEDDEPIPVTADPIHLFGGEKNGVRQYLKEGLKEGESPGRILTLELRPLGPGRFRIGITTTTGLTAVSDRGIISSGGVCQKGAKRNFWWSRDENKMVLHQTLHVEPETGDIVFYGSTGMVRYKRIGD